MVGEMQKQISDLLIPQRRRRIETGGAHCREPGGEEGNYQKQRRD